MLSNISYMDFNCPMVLIFYMVITLQMDRIVLLGSHITSGCHYEIGLQISPGSQFPIGSYLFVGFHAIID